jgi:hypothetical protein
MGLPAKKSVVAPVAFTNFNLCVQSLTPVVCQRSGPQKIERVTFASSVASIWVVSDSGQVWNWYPAAEMICFSPGVGAVIVTSPHDRTAIVDVRDGFVERASTSARDDVLDFLAHHALLLSASFDSSAAISRSRPCAACW